MVYRPNPMAFKALASFQIPKDAIPSQELLNKAGGEYTARECKGGETKYWGYKQFESKKGTAEEFVTPLYNDRWLYFRLSLYKPILPDAVVKQKTEIRASEIAEQTGVPLTAKEKRELKEEMKVTLLSKALQKETVYQVIFDREKGQLWVDATSSAVQDEIIRLLRRSLGSIPATPLFETNNLPDHFISWITGASELPEGVRLGDSAKAIDPHDTKATVTLAHEELLEPDLKSVLETRMIKHVGLETPNITAIINDEGLLKSIKLAIETEDGDADPDHMLAVWCMEIDQMLTSLGDCIGIAKPQVEADFSESEYPPVADSDTEELAGEAEAE